MDVWVLDVDGCYSVWSSWENARNKLDEICQNLGWKIIEENNYGEEDCLGVEYNIKNRIHLPIIATIEKCQVDVDGNFIYD